MKEIWKDIKGYDGWYQVSNKGRVRSWINNAQNKRQKPKILSWAKDRRGYRLIGLPKGTIRIHRLVAESFIPNPKNKPTVNHKDGIKDNNHTSNLEWATYSENYKHARKLGLVHNEYQSKRASEANTGSNQPNSKLSKDDVLEIRKRYKKENILQKELAKEFGVSKSLIGFIVNRKRWSHI